MAKISPGVYVGRSQYTFYGPVSIYGVEYSLGLLNILASKQLVGGLIDETLTLSETWQVYLIRKEYNNEHKTSQEIEKTAWI